MKEYLRMKGLGTSITSWFPPVLQSPGNPWNFAEILEKSWKSPWNVLRSNSLKERFLSKHQDFSGFLSILNVTVYWLTALIFIGVYWIQQCFYILSTSLGDDIQIFKFAIKNLILELWNCISNCSVTVIVLFHSSPFGTC